MTVRPAGYRRVRALVFRRRRRREDESEHSPHLRDRVSLHPRKPHEHCRSPTLPAESLDSPSECTEGSSRARSGDCGRMREMGRSRKAVLCTVILMMSSLAHAIELSDRVRISGFFDLEMGVRRERRRARDLVFRSASLQRADDLRHRSAVASAHQRRVRARTGARGWRRDRRDRPRRGMGRVPTQRRPQCSRRKDARPLRPVQTRSRIGGGCSTSPPCRKRSTASSSPSNRSRDSGSTAKFATGVELRFSKFFTSSTFQAKTFVSNGRGDEPGEKDDNANKGFGGRLTWAAEDETWQVGTSFYTDRNGTADDARQAHVALELVYSTRPDFGWKFIAETNLSQIDPEDDQIDDATYVGGYLDVLYRTRTGWTPWIRVAYSDENTDRVGDSLATYGVGAAYDLNANVRFKASYRYRAQADVQIYLASTAVRF